CQQFELFLSLTKTDASIQRDVLLTFLDLPIYQAVMTSTEEKTRTYDSVKTFLLNRYSTTDEYIDRLSFFDTKYASPPEKFASSLNELFDLFSTKNLKEELLVSRFISATTGKLFDELRLRRPSTLSECVQIANSVHSPSYACFISKPARKPPEDSFNRIVCFCFVANATTAEDKRCPALSVTCRNCGKKGHFSNVCKSPKLSSPSEKRVNTLVCAVESDNSIILRNGDSRPSIKLCVGTRELTFIIDTGSEISVISRHDYDRTLRKKFPLLDATESGVTLRNFDSSILNVDGFIRDLHVTYNEKNCKANFFVASAPFSIIGMDCISALRLNISFSEPTIVSADVESTETAE
ncbi:MAG: retropepsin-like aspartic protease, partial [Pseudomonadota bacterium]